MKSLEKQRARFQAAIQEAGNIEVVDVVIELEKKLESQTSSILCLEAYRDDYIRNGTFKTNGTISSACITNGVDCSPSNFDRVKRYFASRNPHTFVQCFPPADDERTGNCYAGFSPEAFFDTKQ